MSGVLGLARFCAAGKPWEETDFYVENVKAAKTVCVRIYASVMCYAVVVPRSAMLGKWLSEFCGSHDLAQVVSYMWLSPSVVTICEQTAEKLLAAGFQ